MSSIDAGLDGVQCDALAGDARPDVRVACVRRDAPEARVDCLEEVGRDELVQMVVVAVVAWQVD